MFVVCVEGNVSQMSAKATDTHFDTSEFQMLVLRGNVCESAVLGKSGKVQLHWSFPVVSNKNLDKA
jgi:hypothetical protein